MYPKEEIQNIIDNLAHGMTVRGDLVSYSIMHAGKNVELRKKKIKHTYLALHLGSGKINPALKEHLIKNFIFKYSPKDKKYKMKKGHILAILKMNGSKKISELTEEEKKNKWIYSEGGWNVCNYIEKVYILPEPIKSRGFQVMCYRLECINNHLKKKGKFERPIQEKIVEQLKKLIQE